MCQALRFQSEEVVEEGREGEKARRKEGKREGREEGKGINLQHGRRG